MIDYEHMEQAKLITWAYTAAAADARLRNLFAIPNGGHRSISQALRLKAEGVKPGVPDLMLATPSGDINGLFIEMKSLTGRVSPLQSDWHHRLLMSGYSVAVCRSCNEAIAIITQHLGAGR